ncbi:conserved hypothetical protein [Theileria equi strain WA]|uniref:Uncharacterized protein n=1 Tax=Theileria equi strain WA TaxID=1537102 RepID=L1LBX6_THEEQ|nr:conserved hypothetical protein [Theileria equi strain WA]EKX72769.1 conserved hypothetical protein [Theileria equi strain WA]|eukprot:XP_004832221.1 conserved hypothetical protein [Theileria equi strain WA]
MLIRSSRPLRLFRIAPIVDYKPGAGVVYHPSSHDAHLNEQLRRERAAAKGIRLPVRKDCLHDQLNPDGIVQNEWMDFKIQRQPMRGDSDFRGYLSPHVDAFREDDIAKFYNLKDMYERVSVKELLTSMKYGARYTFVLYSGLLLPYLLLFIAYHLNNRLEPLELGIEPEEYNKHVLWHLLGHRLDRQAYIQYAEARRTRKWRDDTINPEDYIPPKYRLVQTYKELEL